MVITHQMRDSIDIYLIVSKLKLSTTGNDFFSFFSCGKEPKFLSFLVVVISNIRIALQPFTRLRSALLRLPKRGGGSVTRQLGASVMKWRLAVLAPIRGFS